MAYSEEVSTCNEVPTFDVTENREKKVAAVLSKVVDLMSDLTNDERLRIIKAGQAFYGAWDGNNKRKS